MSEPCFSIVVPVYNVEKYLSQCVESILRQTFIDFEIILVDDGAKDNSGNLCDQLAVKDERIRVIHKTNGGLSSARNAGIKEACGKYIIFMDSDDYWSNNTMLSQISTQLKYKEDLIIWKYCRCGEDSTFCNDGEHARTERYSLKSDYKVLFGKGILFASAWYEAIPRAWFVKNNLFFEEGVVSEDIEWFSRLLACVTNIIYFDSVFYVYRVRAGSISNTRSMKAVSDIEKHLKSLISSQEINPQLWRACYIGEQVANYAIVLSRCIDDISGLTDEQLNKFSYLSNTVRRRSRVIYILNKFFGSSVLFAFLKKVG